MVVTSEAVRHSQLLGWVCRQLRDGVFLSVSDSGGGVSFKGSQLTHHNTLSLLVSHICLILVRKVGPRFAAGLPRRNSIWHMESHCTRHFFLKLVFLFNYGHFAFRLLIVASQKQNEPLVSVEGVAPPLPIFLMENERGFRCQRLGICDGVWLPFHN